MRLKRQKIRLERGDTLGGTVPLLLRDSVTPNATKGRFLHKDRIEGPGFTACLVAFAVLVVLAVGLWFVFDDQAALIGLPTPAEVGERITGFLAAFE